MLQEESDLSLVIAQIVQKLKGSNLYAQLERQAWVSEAEWEGMETGGAGAMPGPPTATRSPKPEPAAGLPSSAPRTAKPPLQVQAALPQPCAPC